MGNRVLSVAGLVVAAVLFLAVNIIADSMLRTVRVDLTEHKLYTLTAGSRHIAAGVKEPIKLKLYYTPKAANALPSYKSHAARVRELLEEYARLSGGKVKVEVIDPEPYSEAEDEAVAAGVAGLPFGSDRLYLGLVGTNSTDAQEVLPFLDPAKEQFLEYDVTRMLYLLANPKKKTVGVLSSLPLDGERFDPMTGQQGRSPPWQILVQMRQQFDVKMLDAGKPAELTPDLDALMIVHPKALSDEMLYAIDQYVLGGGRTMIFVDPNCESEAIPGMDLMSRMRQDKTSNLKKLFDAWGIGMEEGKIAGDLNNAVSVNVSPNPNRPESVNYVVWLRLGKDNLDAKDPVAGQFQQLILATAGILYRRTGEGANPGLTFNPLIQTGTDSMRIEQSRVQFIPEPKAILADFKSSGERLVLAARLGGKAPSAFSDGSPVKAEAPDAAAPKRPHLKESAAPLNAIVVADVDMASDRFWIQENRLGQILLGYSKVSDNGDFILSALDNLTGSNDLISVRARGQYARPFTRVEQLQKEAEQKYSAEQQRLEQVIRDAEKRIAELQRQRPDSGMQGGQIILTPEQRAEIDRLQGEILRSRKEKRQVEHNLRKDIERLGTTLNIVNTAAVPVVVCLAAVGLGLYRASRRRADRARAA
jgi:ABC-type uncharacterized transport system involved in gliding motility auxiliary subunit